MIVGHEGRDDSVASHLPGEYAQGDASLEACVIVGMHFEFTFRFSFSEYHEGPRPTMVKANADGRMS